MGLQKTLQYFSDVIYSIRNYESGFQRNDVVQGYFVENELGETQRELFNQLLNNNFQRTRWQIVFPGQTAGLIRKIDPPIEGMDEIHVRFYDDGIISTELEYGRFSLGHWRNRREDGSQTLIDIINNEIEGLSLESKNDIRHQIELKEDDAVNPNELELPSKDKIIAYLTNRFRSLK